MNGIREAVFEWRPRMNRLLVSIVLALLLMEFFLTTYHDADFYALASILLMLANIMRLCNLIF